MRWNRWARYGLAILAPALVGVMLAAGEWAHEPVSSALGGKASGCARGQAGAQPDARTRA